jgi:hypothetical protein
MSDEQAVSYDRRAGKFKPWWNDLINHKLAREDLSYKDLAERVGKSRDVIRSVLKSSQFQVLYEAEKARLGKLPAIHEATAALTTGLRFKYSKGQMENVSREFLMDALNNNANVMAKRQEKDAEGKDVWVEYDTGVPVVPFAEKRIIALKIFEIVNGKGTQIIGKQVNVDKSQHVTLNLDNLHPSLRELATAVTSYLPTKEIKGADGSSTFVVDSEEEEEK